jgi:proline- and glutamine-rich splicing factor
VLHLSPHVTNELLEEAFSIFGELERAVVIVDERGKSTGEGIVEFARKNGFNAAMKRINEGVFLLGT